MRFGLVRFNLYIFWIFIRITAEGVLTIHTNFTLMVTITHKIQIIYTNTKAIQPTKFKHHKHKSNIAHEIQTPSPPKQYTAVDFTLAVAAAHKIQTTSTKATPHKIQTEVKQTHIIN